jgi:hypothetical protein
VRTNRPNKAAEPRHRKAGPARLGGPNDGGKRAREVSEDEAAEEESWQQTRSAQ